MPDRDEICPSDAARAAYDDGWRELMTPAHRAAWRLVTVGEVEIALGGCRATPARAGDRSQSGVSTDLRRVSAGTCCEGSPGVGRAQGQAGEMGVFARGVHPWTVDGLK
ncbi:DUF3253 domain-containing protein [Streptomyces sp. NPDC054842]